jgi:hypothetical protein
MDKFINDWGTEVALVIVIIGALFTLWLAWPERKRTSFLWKLSLVAVALAATSVFLYGYLALNGVML